MVAEANQLTVLDGLVQLSAIQGWMRGGYDKEGTPYGPRFFSKRNWESTLIQVNRRVTLRLGRLSNCLACNNLLSPDSTGDHIIPRSWGGPDEATNYFPLCLNCNRSKGTQDLLDWWVTKGYPIRQMTADGLCAYARMSYQFRARFKTYNFARPIPKSLTKAIQSFKPELPSDQHWQVLTGLRAHLLVSAEATA